MIFIDTNILLAAINPNHPKHSAVNQLFAAKKFQQALPTISTQILFEAWASLTRAENANGLGLLPAQAAVMIQSFYLDFSVIDVPVGMMPDWLELVRQAKIVGRHTYDSVIAATMQYHHIENIITYNTKDFAKFSGIVCVTPEDYLAAA